MDNNFYGFSEEPFALDPDPRFLFLTEGHKEALESLVQGIRERKGFSLLTGEKGIGKTTLIHQLLQVLDPKNKAIPLYQPSKSFDELLEIILQELNLSMEEKNRGLMISKLNDYLYQKSAQDETLTIIVDEAQELSREIMEELRLLCSSDPRRPTFLQEILVGQPEIEDRLNSKDLSQLNQRITVRCKLNPLTEEESRQYIEHRLKKVGSSASEIYTPEALSFICRYAKGIPGAINRICYLALAAGYALSQKKVVGAVVEGISSILDRQEEGARKGVKNSISAFIDRFGESSLITKISYALLAYSFLVTIIFYLLTLE